MIVLNNQGMKLSVDYDLKIYFHPSVYYSLVRREAREGGCKGGLGWGMGGGHRNKHRGERGRDNHRGSK